MSVENVSSLGSPSSRLARTLGAATRRVRTLMAIRYAGRALWWSALFGLVWVGLEKLRILEAPSPWLLVGGIALTVVIALGIALFRPLSELDIAKMTERRADLKERFSSALEFRAQGVDASTPFYREQLNDADRNAAGLDLKLLYPFHLSWELPAGMVTALALFLLFYLPTLPAFWTPKQRRDAEAVKVQGIQIVKLSQDTEKAAGQQKLDETRKAAAEARKLGEAMRKGKLDKKQSLVEIQKLTQKMEQKQQELAKSLPQKSPEAARQEFKKSLDKMNQEAEQAQKEHAKKLAINQPRDMKRAGQNAQNPETKAQSEAMKKANEALKQMADALASMDNGQMQQAMEKIAQQMQSGQMSKEETQQLQKALQQLANALKNSPQDKAAQQLQQMAQQMAQNPAGMSPQQMQEMAKMMNQIAKTMGQNPGMGKTMQDLQMMQQLAQALKDGRMTMAMGNGMGNKPGGGMSGKPKRGPGSGWNGIGGPSSAMKDPGATKPNMVSMGIADKVKGVGKSGSAKDLTKYLAGNSPASKHMPNGKVVGSQTQNGQEIQMSFTGDPESAKSNSPYYNVYQTSKKQAESTLNKESIPAVYKDQVRKYFEEIRP